MTQFLLSWAQNLLIFLTFCTLCGCGGVNNMTQNSPLHGYKSGKIGTPSPAPSTVPEVGSARSPSPTPVASHSSSPVKKGEWTSSQVVLKVGNGLSLLQFSCGSGSINEPLIADENGQFHAKGLFTPGALGANDSGQIFPTYQSVYTGMVMGDAMDLILVYTGEEGMVFTQSFHLTFKGRAILSRCE